MTTRPPAVLRAAAEQLGLSIGDAQIQSLLDYIALLHRWNSTYNLTAIRDPSAMLTQHIIDCLAVLGPLRRHSGGAPLRLLDVGSGGGLPGVVLATMASEIDVTCVDTVGKKAAFVQQAAGELRLKNLHARHSRVEALHVECFDVITCRAFASLTDFTRLTAGVLAPAGCWMAMKGKPLADEIASLPLNVEMFHVEHLIVPGLNAERCLIWLRPKAHSPGVDTYN